MEIQEKKQLVSHNTFHISVVADWWVEYSSLEDLDRLSRDEYFLSQPFLPIGEGSNLLFLKDFHGVVLHSQIKTIDLLHESEHRASIRVGSGIVWDDFVVWSLDHGYNGLENLSWIPGSVGASAVQNIGAYGAEVEQFIECVETFDLRTGKVQCFSREECGYGYRNSIFKREEYKHHIITHVVFSLPKDGQINLSYQALKEYCTQESPSPQAVRQAVIEIRKAKLPDPKQLPNAGSFFMNPVVSVEEFERIKEEYPHLPHYPAERGVKLSAAWLLDQTGLKGYQKGEVATYHRQPLILVNMGSASGSEVAEFAQELSDKVFEKFAIRLVPEVRYIG